jgi:hypothetical protein
MSRRQSQGRRAPRPSGTSACGSKTARRRKRQLTTGYLQAWLPWSVAERPVRRSLALYQKLFEVTQLAEMGGGDPPFELVWGMGHARWLKDEREIDLPIVERLVEIEIDDLGDAEIKVRPGAVVATVNLRPYESSASRACHWRSMHRDER